MTRTYASIVKTKTNLTIKQTVTSAECFKKGD